jgi:diguanylate cyclase (GGDEF)-like protein
MNARVRALFNVNVRLLIFSGVLTVFAVGSAVQLWLHIAGARATDREIEQGIQQVRDYVDLHNAVMDYRVMYLRALTLILAGAGQVPQVALDELHAARQRMQADFARIAGREPETVVRVRALLPMDDGLLQTVAALARQGDHPKLKELLGATRERVLGVDQMLARTYQSRWQLFVDGWGDLEALRETNARRALMATAFAVLVALLTVLLANRTVVAPLRRRIAALSALVGGDNHAWGDEFDQIGLATQRLREAQSRLQVLAYQHALTGLPNLARLQEDVRLCMQDSAQGFALAFLDIDHFGQFNEAFGHAVGDQCLRELATRLRGLVAPRGDAYHVSGDRFAVLLPLPGSPDKLPKTAERKLKQLRELFAAPLQIGERQLSFTGSAGVALYPTDSRDSATLTTLADAALREAKRSGRNTVSFALAGMAEQARVNLALADEIRGGVHAGQFQPFFQPIVDVSQRRVVAAEALIRWQHPLRGTILPEQFIDIARQSSQWLDLSDAMLRQSCATFRSWRDLQLAFNLTTAHIGAELPARLAAILDTTGLAPERLTLEITEGAALGPQEIVGPVLRDLRAMRIRLSLDDFGTGYSSLSHLQQLPVQQIKLDRAFCQSLDDSATEQIVAATIALAGRLDLRVVAEGVETPEQSQRLLTMGCRLQQGFLFSPALPAAEFRDWADAYAGVQH